MSDATATSTFYRFDVTDVTGRWMRLAIRFAIEWFDSKQSLHKKQRHGL